MHGIDKQTDRWMDGLQQYLWAGSITESMEKQLFIVVTIMIIIGCESSDTKP